MLAHCVRADLRGTQNPEVASHFRGTIGPLVTEISDFLSGGEFNVVTEAFSHDFDGGVRLINQQKTSA